jgi:hypothetical protein
MSISDFIDFAPIYRHWAFYRHDSVTHVVTRSAVVRAATVAMKPGASAESVRHACRKIIRPQAVRQ